MSTSYFNKFRRVIAISCMAALAGGGLALPAFAAGVQDNGLFELANNSSSPTPGSADILGSTTQNGPDWADIFTTNTDQPTGGLFGGEAAAFAKDDVSAGSAVDRTVYSGGPSDKNSDKVTDWTWTTSSVPAKDDIPNAYAYAKKDSSGQLIIYVGAERLDPSGASHIDVEFFQKPVGLDHSVPCPAGQVCHFTGQNTDGDLLVTMDFTNGGFFAGVTVRARQGNGYVDLATLNTQGCIIDGPLAGTVCAFSNGGTSKTSVGSSIDGGPWDNFDNHGALITQLQPNAFTEWGVNVSELLKKNNLCFSTVQVKTRSSPSFTATLKDFALHEFQRCEANAVTQIHRGRSDDTNHSTTDIQGQAVSVGAEVHDKAIVTGSVGAPTPTGSVTFDRFANGSCTVPAVFSETVPLSVVSAPSGTDPGVAAAESATFTTTTSGSMSYLAVYSGDSTYPTTTAACESLTVNKGDSAVNTEIRLDSKTGRNVLNTKVNAGTDIVDFVQVTGSASNGSGGVIDPTGDVIVDRFATPTCTGDVKATETVTLEIDGDPDGISSAASALYTTGNGEFVGFKVRYSGDSVYEPSSATVCEPLCSFDNSPTLAQP